jgi:hypothetical protein
MLSSSEEGGTFVELPPLRVEVDKDDDDDAEDDDDSVDEDDDDDAGDDDDSVVEDDDDESEDDDEFEDDDESESRGGFCGAGAVALKCSYWEDLMKISKQRRRCSW